MSNYNVTIGLEMHCELKSNSKVFSSAKNSFSDVPNSLVRPLDMGFPGTLPSVNFKCVKDAIKMAIILNQDIAQYFYFDRKNYYYPDLPKGYQITQNTRPIGIGGYIDYECNGTTKTAYLEDLHLEEDTASLTHYNDFSTLNYNRAGVPLLELVTKPCFHSAEEAVAFLDTIKNIYKYCDISDADIKKGQIRCDVNVSISKDQTLGTKVEVKNVNNFKNVYDVINYEIKRQSELYDLGKEDQIEQETRRWDEETSTTVKMRSKADALDYRYFVEPNIPKYLITNNLIDELKLTIPKLPLERKNTYINEYNINETDASIIIKDKSYSDYFENCISLGINPKTASNWLITNVLGYINKSYANINEIYFTPNRLKDLTDLIDKGTISNKQAKEIFEKILMENKEVKEYISSDNAQISDKSIIEDIINNILSNNEKQLIAYKNGKTNLFDFFVGQVMKETKGKANPVITKEILKEKLDK